jgi:hypothetical protein
MTEDLIESPQADSQPETVEEALAIADKSIAEANAEPLTDRV